ncbi:tetratricopeptide repeat-containing sensor histidine kinase [uncultured Tenacibaculum sp.]|uniref:tetratricopeptide repeat-containing sensor histidine kinase n=1 Tax=uncultured Tenacibaculum sp. TaxID=174713 RepID=UPI0026103624|nr:tetratricopeptide repeat-containing sensor histidine kinase [uncultured Tenacibaculum sp.]
MKNATKDNDTFKIGKGYYRSGYYHKKFNETIKAYGFFKKAIPFFLSIKDSDRLGKTYLEIAIIETGFNHFNESENNSVKALKCLSDSIDIASVYNNLGIISRRKKKIKESIDHYKKAINFSTNKINVLTYKNNIANLYGDLEDYTKSINLLDSLNKYKGIKKYPKLHARLIDNLAYKKILNNSYNDEVLNNLIKAKEIRIKEKDKKGLIASYAHLSDYFKSSNKKKSREYAYKMIEISKKENSPEDLIEGYDKLKYLEKTPEALKISIKRSQLKDSLELARNNAQNRFAYIRHNSEENEKRALESEKKVIQEKLKNKEKSLELEQQKSLQQLWAFLGSLSLLILIAYFFYKRQKTKKEKIIEVYKTETRLAKKIHDELANDVYLAMNKIQNNTIIKSTDLLADLDKIYKQTRDISHENSPVITGEKFQEFLQQLFIDFTTDTCKIINKGLSEIEVSSIVKEKQIILYRVLQELLVNMKKHSKANLVVIAFDKEKDKIKVRYKDNGVGVQLIANKNGLNNMETRIKSIGGTITFDSEKQKGFQAKFQFKK